MPDPPFSPPTSKQDVLGLIATHRGRIAELADRLDDDQFARVPGPQPDRSAKDLLMHLVWWEQSMMSRVLMVRAGVEAAPIDDVDAINEQIHAVHRDLAPALVRETFRVSGERLVAFIEALAWAELDGGLRIGDTPVGYLVAGTTFGHCARHAESLARFVGELD